MVSSLDLNFNDAVNYHYDSFPPKNLDFAKLIKPLTRASAALARYDQMLRGLHNSEVLLGPLRNQEAIVSSRIEGTVSTLDEVLRYEADQEAQDTDRQASHRSEAIEVFLYSRALKQAQHSISDGHPMSKWLLRSAHRTLLSFGRGAHLSPGEFKKEQNYLIDRVKRKVMFTPISPEQLESGIDNLIDYINSSSDDELIKAALSHIEFEALHPFKDGNGRIGRMLITLILWKKGLITAPHFYISGYFERHKDEYIDRMRSVSQDEKWTEWIIFFLEALEAQATENLDTADKIQNLYEDMKDVFRELFSSQWSTTALDFMFSRPIFRNNVFTGKSGIPSATAQRFTRSLVDTGYLVTLENAAGRRPAMYAFEPLLSIVRT